MGSTLIYLFAIVETGMLIAGMFFMTRIIKEKKHTPAHKALVKKASICLMIYLVMNVIRNYYL